MVDYACDAWATSSKPRPWFPTFGGMTVPERSFEKVYPGSVQTNVVHEP
jgi:hypothetical protein